MSVWLSAWDSLMLSDLISGGDASRLTKALGLDLLKSLFGGGRHLPFQDDGKSTVPFVAVFDNCFDGIEHDLVDKELGQGSDWLKSAASEFVDSFSVIGREMVRGQLRGLLKDGLILYAAPPGSEVAMVPDPTVGPEGGKASSSAPVGPLASRMLSAFQKKHDVVKFGDLARTAALASESTESGKREDTQVQPYVFDGEDFRDDVVLFPSSADLSANRVGTVDKWSGSGTIVTFCCNSRLVGRHHISDLGRQPQQVSSLAYYQDALTDPVTTWVFETFRAYLGPGQRCASGYTLKFSKSGSVEVDECQHGRRLTKTTPWSLKSNGRLDPILSYDGMSFEVKIDPEGQERYLHLLKKGSEFIDGSADQTFREMKN